MKNAKIHYQQIKIETLDDPACADFKQLLSEVTELNTLSLCGNSYGLGFFQQLAPLLRKLKSVHKIYLSDIFVSRKESIVPSLALLAEALSHKDIVYVIFSENALCGDGIKALVPLFTSNPIKYLHLNHVGLSRDGCATLADAITKGGLRLRALTLPKNRIETESESLAAALQDQTELEEFIAFQNNITGKGMEALLRSLASCRALRHLNIADNAIKQAAVDRLNELIERDSRLEHLNIADCNIGFKDSETFFQRLLDHPPARLHTLIYSYNDSSDLEFVSRAVKLLPALKRFEFKHFEHKSDQLERAKTHLEHLDTNWESEEEKDEDQSMEEEVSKEDRIKSEQSKIDDLIKGLDSLKLN